MQALSHIGTAALSPMGSSTSSLRLGDQGIHFGHFLLTKNQYELAMRRGRPTLLHRVPEQKDITAKVALLVNGTSAEVTVYMFPLFNQVSVAAMKDESGAVAIGANVDGGGGKGGIGVAGRLAQSSSASYDHLREIRPQSVKKATLPAWQHASTKLQAMNSTNDRVFSDAKQLTLFDDISQHLTAMPPYTERFASASEGDMCVMLLTVSKKGKAHRYWTQEIVPFGYALVLLPGAFEGGKAQSMLGDPVSGAGMMEIINGYYKAGTDVPTATPQTNATAALLAPAGPGATVPAPETIITAVVSAKPEGKKDGDEGTKDK
ncbi:hypothetical protein JKP88DRAFT_255645 [Tribonema minus]|uniref:Uncharacterized protein n=1 Tax=Tribonema minus TaxID=303371 RepID=A0A835YYR8_9STRA|nr:hypothetical protein JKP88DRAFT_255645 [Tribonema minus]